jgi:hypothetical protein
VSGRLGLPGAPPARRHEGAAAMLGPAFEQMPQGQRRAA